jgi:hypothetical protein
MIEPKTNKPFDVARVSDPRTTSEHIRALDRNRARDRSVRSGSRLRSRARETTRFRQPQCELSATTGRHLFQKSRPFGFEAPKGQTLIAQGNALGTVSACNHSPEGATPHRSRPFRAVVIIISKPKALPWAIEFCPVGAKRISFRTSLHWIRLRSGSAGASSAKPWRREFYYVEIQ